MQILFEVKRSAKIEVHHNSLELLGNCQESTIRWLEVLVLYCDIVGTQCYFGQKNVKESMLSVSV
jgi:hypothetical protein